MSTPEEPRPGGGPNGGGESAGGGEPSAGPSGAGGGRPSGLRDPVRAVRGLGAATLILEALVLLLAIQPIRILGGDLRGSGIAVVLVGAAVALGLAGALRREWAWYAGTLLQGGLMLGGLLHWSIFAIGLIFAVVWAYVLHVRRTILG